MQKFGNVAIATVLPKTIVRRHIHTSIETRKFGWACINRKEPSYWNVFGKNKVSIIKDFARFFDALTVGGNGETIAAKHIWIAINEDPRHPFITGASEHQSVIFHRYLHWRAATPSVILHELVYVLRKNQFFVTTLSVKGEIIYLRGFADVLKVEATKMTVAIPLYFMQFRQKTLSLWGYVSFCSSGVVSLLECSASDYFLTGCFTPPHCCLSSGYDVKPRMILHNDLQHHGWVNRKHAYLMSQKKCTLLSKTFEQWSH